MDTNLRLKNGPRRLGGIPPLPPLAPVFQRQGCPLPQWDVDIPFVSWVSPWMSEEAPKMFGCD